MPLLITDPMLGDINTLSIPTDAIFTVTLLIVFTLTGYLFHNIISNDTNQFAEKINAASKIELVKEEFEDRLAHEVNRLDPKNIEKPINKKLHFLPSAKLVGLSSLAVIGIGGTSLIGLQTIQKTYEGMRTSQANIKLENQSTKIKSSLSDLKLVNKPKKNIKKMSYFDPFLSTIKMSKDNNYYQVREKEIENIFSF